MLSGVEIDVLASLFYYEDFLSFRFLSIRVSHFTSDLAFLSLLIFASYRCNIY